MLKKFGSMRPLDPCMPFQVDLSTMVDDELDEGSASRVLVHVETCDGCRDFLRAVRGQVVVHRQLADPSRLSRVLEMLEKARFFPAGDPQVQLRRLATIYFRLGKAYAMLVLDRKFQTRLLEEPVAIDEFKVRGRHFVENVLLHRKGEGIYRGYDWVKARYLLNGRLDDEGENLEKGRLLLEEALVVRPRFAEPRVFLAFCHRYYGEYEKAEELLGWVLRHGRKPVVRASAAIHMGAILGERDEFRAALRFSRWVLQRREDVGEVNLFNAYYNTAIYYAQMGDEKRSSEYFRRLSRRLPGTEADAGSYLRRSPVMSQLLARRPEFTRELGRISPALVLADN